MNSLDVKHCSSSDIGIGDLHALIRRDVLALFLSDYASNDTCIAVANTFDRSMFGGYDSVRYVLPAQRFGPTLNEHRVNNTISDRYWSYANEAAVICERMGEFRDLRNRTIQEISQVLKRRVRPATIKDGRRLYWGILREINDGTLIHWDDILQEYPPDMLATSIVGQLAFNLFLTAPRFGGQTRIWNKQWAAKDEQYREGFGYRPEAVQAASSVHIRPAQGAATIFNSRNYHRVIPCEPGESRLSLSFFIGVTIDDNVIVWS